KRSKPTPGISECGKWARQEPYSAGLKLANLTHLNLSIR
ncbi:MAG: hypothetical protein ACI88A_003709, partial [Paraglaciecola sp.]